MSEKEYVQHASVCEGLNRRVNVFELPSYTVTEKQMSEKEYVQHASVCGGLNRRVNVFELSSYTVTEKQMSEKVTESDENVFSSNNDVFANVERVGTTGVCRHD